jgi:hypothetical protein
MPKHTTLVALSLLVFACSHGDDSVAREPVRPVEPATPVEPEPSTAKSDSAPTRLEGGPRGSVEALATRPAIRTAFAGGQVRLAVPGTSLPVPAV